VHAAMVVTRVAWHAPRAFISLLLTLSISPAPAHSRWKACLGPGKRVPLAKQDIVLEQAEAVKEQLPARARRSAGNVYSSKHFGGLSNPQGDCTKKYRTSVAECAKLSWGNIV